MNTERSRPAFDAADNSPARDVARAADGRDPAGADQRAPATPPVQFPQMTVLGGFGIAGDDVPILPIDQG